MLWQLFSTTTPKLWLHLTAGQPGHQRHGTGGKADNVWVSYEAATGEIVISDASTS
jgi:hypothetical protein